ncbi:MAG: glycosyl hydrolase family 18 protein [Vallitalea sp.]|jgi:spore germination protein YaaH|nr:glycosyl hydrolase family 18 protein [Vallitalea sp.]
MKRIVAFIIVFFILILAGIFGYQYIVELLPNYEKARIEEIIPDYEKEKISIIIEDKYIKGNYPPKKVNDEIYLPIDFVNTYIDPYYHWDKKEKTLTYTTNNKVIRMKNEELTYFVNSEPLQLDMPIMTFDTDMVYIPMNIILGFTKVKFEYNEDFKLLIFDDINKRYRTSNVKKKKAYLRVSASDKSKVEQKLLLNEELRIYGQASPEGWVKARSKNGLIGYIRRSDLGVIKDIFPNIIKKEESNSYNTKKNIKGKINIAWHQVTNITANNKLKNVLENVEGLDVISPTWFSIKNTEGDISNIASKEYVNYAKSKGYQVWALFSNRFNKKITHEVLSSTEKREKVIKQILALTSIYNLDGINVDFENVAKEDGKYYVQFIRELTPYLKAQDVIVSVDMYVPSAWTAHYNRTELGKVIDYLIIMAYDEHWSTSPESGSVASIGFVEKGIVNTLKEVPKEKVILGLPYYTRLWKEETIDGKLKVSSVAYSMERAKMKLDENNAEIIWNDDVKQFYGDYKKGNVTYKIWLEEEQSIEEKVKLMKKYDLMGVAGWKIGLQKKEVWDVLYNYLKK